MCCVQETPYIKPSIDIKSYHLKNKSEIDEEILFCYARYEAIVFFTPDLLRQILYTSYTNIDIYIMNYVIAYRYKYFVCHKKSSKWGKQA